MTEEKIRLVIKNALPNINEDKVESIFTLLTATIGVETEDQLEFIEESDLERDLNAIQRRMLLKYITKNFKSSVDTEVSNASIASSSPQSVPTSSPQNYGSVLRPSISWSDVPNVDSAILSTLEEKAVIDCLASQVVKNNNLRKLPSDETWTYVISELVKRNPRFEKHRVPGNKCSPYAGLAMSLRNRGAYYCRQIIGNENDGTATMNSPFTSPSSNKRKKTARDLFRLPEGETLESLDEKTKELQTMATKAPTEWNDDIIRFNMTALHSKIRSTVEDNQPDFDDLLTTYPFLLKPRWTCHFLELRHGINAEECISKFIDDHIEDAIKFLTRKSSSVDLCVKIEKRMDAAARETESRLPYIVGGLEMIATHLEKSKFKGIFILIDASTSDDDIAKCKEIPSIHPALVALGPNAMTAENFCLVANGVVLGRTTSIVQALASYFSAFYAMHLKYPKDLAVFLEFIQRYIMNIGDSDDVTPSSRGKTMKPGRQQAFSLTASKLYQSIVAFGN